MVMLVAADRIADAVQELLCTGADPTEALVYQGTWARFYKRKQRNGTSRRRGRSAPFGVVRE